MHSQSKYAEKGYKLHLKKTISRNKLKYELTIPPKTKFNLGFDADVNIEKGSLIIKIKDGSMAGYYSNGDTTVVSVELNSNEIIKLNSEYIEIMSDMIIYLSKNQVLITIREDAQLKRNINDNVFTLVKGLIYYVKI